MSLLISSVCREQLGADLGNRVGAGPVGLDEPLLAREIALSLRSRRPGTEAVTAGNLFALSVLSSAYRGLLETYLEQVDPTLLARLISKLVDRMGSSAVESLLKAFETDFLGLESELTGQSSSLATVQQSGVAVRAESVLGLLVVWLLESNPAAQPLVRHLHAGSLVTNEVFQVAIVEIADILSQEPGFDDDGALLDVLRQPAETSPVSLRTQIEWIGSRWLSPSGEPPPRIEVGLDMLAEEERPLFPPGPGPVELPVYEDVGDPAYSPDRSWMAGLVLVAKHTLVWLRQLTEQYGRPIALLDEVPQEEIERLSSLGFSGLWLIGIWRRSPASRTIKRLCGNPDAVASAYSLSGYQVADDLGGDEALLRLRERAAAAGIRLAADMVPNHTGIDSDLVVERPDWFIRQPKSPFPAYDFSGPDLSTDRSVGIHLERHYFDRSDAAVVFKRHDRRADTTSFIYHGNDGTSTPWNDTAQLDYTNPEVREFVISTILEVARKVPIIRFDAAMTLTQRHFQRLWFPAPGTAGAIPSRADHGMSRSEFLEKMPEEFWRQVVDRISEEIPDTLLLAEAFWLLEGYFVRSLGMHRVYNSAFMNMLRDGETSKFRRLIRETLEFDPQILRRYVNFMSNPDERTASDQFGRDDRYFGTCALMAALPGLPMFGHGQVEGLTERYGMEYSRSYSSEKPDTAMIDRHREQILPLLRKRNLFAGVGHFELYDLEAYDGTVNENVVAFSNALADESVVFLFNNSPYTAHGRIHRAAARLDESSGKLAVSKLGNQLVGKRKEGYLRFHDRIAAREYFCDIQTLRSRGLAVDLRPFEFRVWTDFAVSDLDASLGAPLTSIVGPRGAEDLDELLESIRLEPAGAALEETLDLGLLTSLSELATRSDDVDVEAQTLGLISGLEVLHRSLVSDTGRAKIAGVSDLDRDRIAALVSLPKMGARLQRSRMERRRLSGLGLTETLRSCPELLPTLFGWIVLSSVHDRLSDADPKRLHRLNQLVESRLAASLLQMGIEAEVTASLVALLRIAVEHGWGRQSALPPQDHVLMDQFTDGERAIGAIGTRESRGDIVLIDQGLRRARDWRLLVETLGWSSRIPPGARLSSRVEKWWSSLDHLYDRAKAVRFRLKALREEATTDPIAPLSKVDSEIPSVQTDAGEKRTTTSE